MRRKWTPRPYELWDSASVERWLEDEAAKGWRMTGCSGWCAAFQRAEPAACRVRIRPQEPEAKEARQERGDLYREFGWEFGAVIVDGGCDYEVWYCGDPAAPELDTDPVAQGWAWEKSLRHGWIAGWICLVVIPAVWGGMFWLIPGGPLETFLDLRFNGLLISAVLLPLYMVWQARAMWQIRRVRREIRAGVAPGSKGNWRKRRRVWVIWSLLFLLYWAALFTNIGGYRVDRGPVVLSGIRAEVLAPEETWEFTLPFVRNSSPLRPCRQLYRMRGSGGHLVENSYDRVRFAFLAEPVYRERLAEYREAMPDAALTVLDREEFERAALLRNGEESALVVCRGKVVYALYVELPVELTDYLEEAAAVLAEQP